MFELFIDESGYVQNYRANTHHIPDNKYFVLGGIIVEQSNKHQLEDIMKEIIQDNFGHLELNENFKLHYNKLRQAKTFPYDQLTGEEKKKISDRVFDAINTCDCTLVSAQIDLDYIYKKYIYKIHQRIMALNFITERFEYFLRENQDTGQIVHEYVTVELNKKMQTNYGKLHLTHNLSKKIEFENVNKKINFAKVKKEPILQFSDFFAYSILIRAKSNREKQDRWVSICDNYYNLNHINKFHRGNYSL